MYSTFMKKTTKEDMTLKAKTYTEVSIAKAKDEVLIDGATKQAAKERGAVKVELRKLEQDRQQYSKQI